MRALTAVSCQKGCCLSHGNELPAAGNRVFGIAFARVATFFENKPAAR